MLALLHKHILVWTSRVLTELRRNIINVEFVAVKLSLIVDSLHEFLDLLLGGLASAATAAAVSWLNLLEDLEEFEALVGSEIDLSIGVHAVSERGLTWALSLDVLNVLLVGEWLWALESDILCLDEWEELRFVEKAVVHEVIEEAGAETSIPIVDDMTTVHNVTENVLEISPWDLA